MFQRIILLFQLHVILYSFFLQVTGWCKQFAKSSHEGTSNEGKKQDAHTSDDSDSESENDLEISHRISTINRHYRDVFTTLEEQRSCQSSPFFIEQNSGLVDVSPHHSHIRDFGRDKKQSPAKSVTFAFWWRSFSCKETLIDVLPCVPTILLELKIK